MSYSTIQVHRALRKTLKNMYRFVWLDVIITPVRVDWYAAVQLRDDPERRWIPRIISFYPKAQKVVYMSGLNDSTPTMCSAEATVAMAASIDMFPPPRAV